MAGQASAPRVPTEHKRQRWANLPVFAFAQFSDGQESSLNALFPAIANALELDSGALGTLSGIGKVARIVFGALWAIVGDKYGRKKVLVFVTGVWGLWIAVAGLARTYPQLLILYALGAIGAAAAGPIQNGLLAGMFEDRERGQAYSNLSILIALFGVFLTPIIGRLANTADGWRYGLFLMGGLSLLSGILIQLFVKEPPRVEVAAEPDAGKFRMSDIGGIIKTPTIGLLAVHLLLSTSTVLFAFFITYHVEVRGWTTPSAAVLYTAFMAGFGLSGFLGGYIGDFLQKKLGPKGRVMLMQVSLAAFAVMTFLMLQINWGMGLMVYIVAFLCGLAGSLGANGSVLPMVAAVVEPRCASTAFALLFSFVGGTVTAVTMLLIEPLTRALGSLQNVMLYLVTIPYAINAAFWFVFYRFYPKDAARR